MIIAFGSVTGDFETFLYLRQPRERLLHFGRLVHGIIVVETKLVESSSTKKMFSMFNFYTRVSFVVVAYLKAHRFHPTLSKKVLLGITVTVLKKKVKYKILSLD